MATEIVINTECKVLCNSKKILSNTDIIDLIVIDTNYNYRFFTDNFSDNFKYENTYKDFRQYLISEEYMGIENFKEDENNNFIKTKENAEDIMYVSDISSGTKEKHMVEFFGNENDKKLFHSLDITISKGIGIKNATLGLCFRIIEGLKDLHACAIFGISDLEIYEHKFENKVYKIIQIALDTESG